MPFMVRMAENSFYALLTANGMEAAGAEVVSVAYDGQHQPEGAMIPSSRYAVFARVRDKAHIDAVDDAIEKAITQALRR